MNGIANERLGQSLQAFEQAFSDFSSRGRVWKTGEKDSDTMRSIVAEILFVLQRDKKDDGFCTACIMERRNMSGQTVNYYRRH